MLRVPIPSPSSVPTVPKSMVDDSNESKLMDVMATQISSMRERLASLMVHYPSNSSVPRQTVEPVEPKMSPTATPTRAEEIKHRIQQLKEAMKFLVCFS